jgi:hypothetical protein
MSIRTPSYRRHKARGCAVVTIDGRDHYLGAYDSPPSWEKYHRLVAEWMPGAIALPPAALPAELPLTVTELVARYWRFARGFYVKGVAPTSEVAAVKQAVRFLRRLYGSTPACDFTPKKLKAVRQPMIDHKVTRRYKVRDPETGEASWAERVLAHGLARRTINKQVARIKRLFAWAVEEELVGASVHQALQRVVGLKKGKSPAREKPASGPCRPATSRRCCRWCRRPCGP